MTTTSVVRLRRQGGKVVQDCDIYIGRSCTMGGWNLTESKWHNPFSVKGCGTAEEACRKYETYIRNKPSLLKCLSELEGKKLGCWCKHTTEVSERPTCHGEILLKLLEEKKEGKLDL